MSVPLKDFRTAVPESVDVWLEIESLANGEDKAAIGRRVLRDWARAKQHAYNVATRKLAANGLQPELFGDDAVDGATSAGDGGTARNSAAGRGVRR